MKITILILISLVMLMGIAHSASTSSTKFKGDIEVANNAYINGTMSSSSVKTQNIQASSISCSGSISSESVSASTVTAETVKTDRITAKSSGDPIILNGEVIITN